MLYPMLMVKSSSSWDSNILDISSVHENFYRSNLLLLDDLVNMLVQRSDAAEKISCS